jgi:hypothetical protein
MPAFDVLAAELDRTDFTTTLALLPGIDFRLDKTDETVSQKPPWCSVGDWSREQKVIALNAGTMAAIAAVGFVGWDYGSHSFNTAHEGWFGADTPYGGADKLGHVFACYALASVYNRIYQGWGYSDHDAIFLGTASSWLTMTVIEVGDGFSKSQGFSWQDEVMNTVGAGMAYLRHRVPAAGNVSTSLRTTPVRSFCSPSNWTAG